MPETAFLGAQIAPRSLSAGAWPQTPLGELTALPQTPIAAFKGPYSIVFAYPFHFGKSGFSAYFFTPNPDIRILSGFFYAGPYL